MNLFSCFKFSSASLIVLTISSCSNKGSTSGGNTNNSNDANVAIPAIKNNATEQNFPEKVNKISSEVFNESNNPLPNPQKTTNNTSLNFYENMKESKTQTENFDIKKSLNTIKEIKIDDDCADLFQKLEEAYQSIEQGIKATSEGIVKINVDDEEYKTIKKYITKQKNEDWMAVNWDLKLNENDMTEIMNNLPLPKVQFSKSNLQCIFAAGANDTNTAFKISLNADIDGKNADIDTQTNFEDSTKFEGSIKGKLNFAGYIDSSKKIAELGMHLDGNFEDRKDLLKGNINFDAKTKFEVLPSPKITYSVKAEIKGPEEKKNVEGSISVAKTSENTASIAVDVKLTEKRADDIKVVLGIEKIKNGKCIIKIKK